MLKNPNAQGGLVLVVVLLIAGVYILNNRQPAETVAQPILPPTATSPPLQDWQVAMQAELTALPSATTTTNVTNTPFVPPTLPPTRAATVAVVPQGDVGTRPTLTPLPPNLVTPSPAFVQNTPFPTPQGLDNEMAQFGIPSQDNPQQFGLPPEQIPLSAHPYDHYYLARPIDVTANSEYLFYYPYGSSGSQGWRVHHGLDMPNIVGEEVKAAADGVVVWADRTLDTEIDGDLEVYASYGNVVVIEHDFGWRGQPVWTLYAHMSAITVAAGQRVEMGDTVGLVGVTGQVTGPHVHFEVRLGRNSYYSTRNPILWMAPYVGHGVVAGRVWDENGEFVDNVLVQLNQNGRIVDSTTTYISPYEAGKRVWTVVPDDNWNENFAMGDVPEGEYQLVVVVEEERYMQTIDVVAGTTKFVEILVKDGVPVPPQTPIPTAIQATGLPTAIPGN